MTTLLHDELIDCVDEQSVPVEVIAREGSALAEYLRSSGWVARAGWRTTGDDGRSVWQLRFERLVSDESTTQ